MFPIVDRELRVRSRDSRTFHYRITIACLACCATMVCLVLASFSANPSESGRTLFILLGWSAFLLCLFEGLRTAADSISEEKREGTLGLLFLTDLSSMDVLLGKQAGIALNSFYALLSAVPFLGVPLLLGGITAGEYWRLVLTLFATLAFSLSVGTLVSICSRDLLVAWVRTGSILMGVAGVVPLIGWMRDWHIPGPLTALTALQSQIFDTDPGVYWSSFWTTLAMSLVAFLAGALLMPRVWQGGDVSRRWIPETRRLPGEAWLQRGGVAEDPVAWFAARQSPRPRSWGVYALVIAVVLPCAAVLAPPTIQMQQVLAGLFVAGLLVLSAAQALVAVDTGATLRGTGVLDLLFIAPLRPMEVTLGLGRGSIHVGLRLLVLFWASYLLSMAIAAWRIFLAGGANAGVLVTCAVSAVAACTLCFDFFATNWMGIYQGMMQKRRGVALAWTFFWGPGSWVLIGGLGMACVFPVLGPIKTVVVWLWARDRLLFEFPRIVRDHHTPSGPSAGERSNSRGQG